MEKAKNVCLVGAAGKMGRAILDALYGEHGLLISAKVDVQEGYLGIARISEVNPLEVDVVINFTNPGGTINSAEWCLEHGKPLVTGTTGLPLQHIDSLKNCGEKIPVLWAPNMSLGVNLIDALLPQIAKILQGFEVEIVEIHHNQKKDSPSGTALRFAETLVKAKGGEIIFGRAKGKSDNRPITDVVVHAIRGGSVPGEHTIYFLGPDEIIEITHRALSRKIFALGALKAAQWIIGQKPGLYSMKDVLGL